MNWIIFVDKLYWLESKTRSDDAVINIISEKTDKSGVLHTYTYT